MANHFSIFAKENPKCGHEESDMTKQQQKMGVLGAGPKGRGAGPKGTVTRDRAMATWRRDGRLTGGQRLVCAGLAGVLSLSLTAPLELATVLAQVGRGPGPPQGPWAASRSVWRAEGPRALWKGNGVACLRLFPYSVLQLAAYLKFLLLFMDDRGYISQWHAIMAGSLAGMVATIVTYPTDVIKTRLIMQNLQKPSYTGISHAFCTIYHQEGFLALYRGISLTVIGALPFSAGSFLVYVNLNHIWNGPRDRFSPFQNFANSCLAAGVAQTISYPFDTVKRKMQAQSHCLSHCGRVGTNFSGAVDCFQQVVKTQGVLALWNGLTANLLKIVPYFGVMFSTFEFCKRIYLYQNGYTVSPLSYKLTPGVDQSLQPQELRELQKLVKNDNFEARKPTL